MHSSTSSLQDITETHNPTYEFAFYVVNKKEPKGNPYKHKENRDPQPRNPVEIPELAAYILCY